MNIIHVKLQAFMVAGYGVGRVGASYPYAKSESKKRGVAEVEPRSWIASVDGKDLGCHKNKFQGPGTVRVFTHTHTCRKTNVDKNVYKYKCKLNTKTHAYIQT